MVLPGVREAVSISLRSITVGGAPKKGSSHDQQPDSLHNEEGS